MSFANLLPATAFQRVRHGCGIAINFGDAVFQKASQARLPLPDAAHHAQCYVQGHLLPLHLESVVQIAAVAVAHNLGHALSLHRKR